MLLHHAKVAPKSKRTCIRIFLAAFQFSSLAVLVAHAVLVARAAQHVAMPTISQSFNFRKKNFRDQKSYHEIHKNTVPQKLGAVRYNMHVRKILNKKPVTKFPWNESSELSMTLYYHCLHHLLLLRGQAELVGCLGPQYEGHADIAACCGTATAQGELREGCGTTPSIQTRGSAEEHTTQCQEMSAKMDCLITDIYNKRFVPKLVS